MLSSEQSEKTPSRQSEKRSQHSSYDSGSLWERLAYGGSVTLVTAGPIWAGMDAVAWMATYIGVNAGIAILCCLLGCWKELRGPTQVPRRII